MDADAGCIAVFGGSGATGRVLMDKAPANFLLAGTMAPRYAGQVVFIRR